MNGCDLKKVHPH